MSKSQEKTNNKSYIVIEDDYQIEDSGASYRIIPTGDGSGFNRVPIANFSYNFEKRILEYPSPETDPCIYYKARPKYKGRLGASVDLDKDKLRKKYPDVYTHRGERVYPGKAQFFPDMTFAQMGDENIPEEIRFGFMGMYEDKDKGLVFLNKGYSIDKNGPTDEFNVQLPECFRNYEFVANSENYDLSECIRITVEILENTWQAEVSTPTLAYTIGSVVNIMHSKHGNEDNSILNLLARSGSGKSTLAKFMLSLFSIYPHAAPATISFADTTANAMKTILCAAHYCLVLIDDVRLDETSKDREKKIDKQNALSETIGNRTYKQILNGDSTLAPGRISHASVLITSEQELPMSPAANARMTTVEFSKDELALRKSFPYQKHLDKINLTGQDFILFFIQNYDRIDKVYDKQMEYYANLIPVGGHERVTYNISHLMFNNFVWDCYLIDRGIISKSEFTERQKTAETLFVNLAASQNERVKDVSITALALQRIQSSISSGRRYWKACKNGITTCAESSIKSDTRLSSTSTCIGYVDREKGMAYLIPEETFKAIEDYEPFPTSANTLWKMMAEEGMLQLGEPRKDKDGKTNRRRFPKVTINGETRRFLALKLRSFDDDFLQNEGGEIYEE